MDEAAADELRILIRSVRQRLEALRSSGLDRLPMRPLPAFNPMNRPAREVVPRRPQPVLTPTTASAPREPIAPVAPRPSVPTPPPSPTRVERPVGPPPVAATLFGEPELEPVIPEANRALVLATLAAEVSCCTRCPELATTRKQTVFGEGSPTARLMFVGEAPGADEDQTGRPFVGAAGTLLTDMITKGMGLRRDEVYIANVLKSRPPGNRTPLPDEISHCLPYLERQIATIRPQFLCLLGKTAALALLETALPLGRLRGKWHRYRSIPTIVTYHPAALLRNPAWKKDTWTDLQTLMQAMGIKSPERRRPE